MGVSIKGVDVSSGVGVSVGTSGVGVVPSTTVGVGVPGVSSCAKTGSVCPSSMVMTTKITVIW